MGRFFLFLYNIAVIVLLIPASLYILIFSNKYRKEFFYKLSERLVFWKPLKNPKSKKVIWIHCSSLGEVRASEPIIDELKKDYFIVLTTVTKTGREYAKKINKADFLSLLPIDIYPFVIRALNIIKPDMLILVETEIWASLLYAAQKKNIKVVTINGRMSEKSFKIYKKMKNFWKYFLSSIDIVLARSKEDAQRFAYLTDKKAEIHITGNIKYDRDFSQNVKREKYKLSERDFIITAGSTREGEEEIIIKVYKNLIKKFKNIKIFLAPRHLSKIGKVKKILTDKKIDFDLLSEISENSRFILVDVFGKLQNVYSVSDICYVGGSLVKKGGQNPIEPAAYGKPVLFGKHMENFKSEAQILVEAGGAKVVRNAKDLAFNISYLISHKAKLQKMGQSAFIAVNDQKGAVKKTINFIRERI